MLPDGMICESSREADSWRYDGFGTWVPRAESYTSCMYSRNRPLVLLSMLGLGAEALRTADFLNRWLMYYPEQELYFGEVAIPGHWSVIPNKAARVLPGTRRGRVAHSLYEGAFRRGFPELRAMPSPTVTA